jgi:hypothetical protein
MMKTPQPTDRPLSERAWDAALGFVLSQEGGYIDHPKDPGGPTYKGVSLRAVVGLRKEDGGDFVFDLDHDGDVDRSSIDIIPCSRGLWANNCNSLESCAIYCPHKYVTFSGLIT